MTPGTLRIAYTPDPDDAFHFFALEYGHVRLTTPQGEPVILDLTTGHVDELNRRALRRELDVTAISSAFYPRIDQDYVVLSSGASVGRGYGPVLAGPPGSGPRNLAGLRVAVPGTTTTGAFLLSYFHRDFEAVPLPFDQVAGAITDGSVDAGVLIHEELLHCRESGVEKWEDLGAHWCRETDLPLPVGLQVARRSLGEAQLERIREALAASLRWALEHRSQALAFACRFGRGAASRHRDDFVDRFANQDTLSMPADVRQGLRELYRRAHARGLIDHEPVHQVI